MVRRYSVQSDPSSSSVATTPTESPHHRNRELATHTHTHTHTHTFRFLILPDACVVGSCYGKFVENVRKCISADDADRY